MTLHTLLAQNPLQGTLKAPGAFQPGTGTGAAVGGTPLELFFSILIGLMTAIGGLMFLMYFIFGALSWISSNGDKGKLESARSQLVAAAVGLIIVLLSQAIVGIAAGVLGLDVLNPTKILEGMWK